MPTVYEVALRASNQGKLHINIFHVFDGNDNAVMVNISNYFINQLRTPLLPGLSLQFRYEEIAIQSITAVNPGAFSSVSVQTGTNVSEPMPTGNHLYVKLLSADPSFKSGGKLMGGWTEGSYVNGVPNNVLLDFVQDIFNPFISGMNAAIGVDLAIYRPTLSLPGIPAVSIVAGSRVRGGSTNNRRNLAFAR